MKVMLRMEETMSGEQLLVSGALRDMHFLSSATHEELAYLQDHSQHIALKRFEILYHTGEINTRLYYVVAGVMKISTHLPHGKEVIRKICHPGMLLGEGSLSGEKIHTALAQSLDRHTRLIQISAEAIREVMLSNSRVGLAFFDYFSLRLKKTEYRLESVIAEDARTRVINFLKDNALLYGNKVGYNELLLKHNYTQQDIADFTGTSRQTVTTILNDLKRSNMISMNRRRILIRNIDDLS